MPAHAKVKTALEQEGLATPTQIQKYAIPIILGPKKVDLLASAQTGCASKESIFPRFFDENHHYIDSFTTFR